MTKIAEAVAPEKSAAMDRAADYAAQVVANVTKQLAEAGWDQDKVAAYPKGSSSNYHAELAKYTLFSRLTRSTAKGSRSFSEPNFVEVNPEAVARFVEEARQGAAAAHEAFVAKLESKIGEVEEAVLAGSHVWSHSVLTVTKVGGGVERWKTQTILNVSKLGKVFHQFPSRKVK